MSTLKEIALAANVAYCQAEEIRSRQMLVSEMSRILGYAIPFPDENSVEVEGIKFWIGYDSETRKQCLHAMAEWNDGTRSGQLSWPISSLAGLGAFIEEVNAYCLSYPEDSDSI